jgi:hypothetical protein
MSKAPRVSRYKKPAQTNPAIRPAVPTKSHGPVRPIARRLGLIPVWLCVLFTVVAGAWIYFPRSENSISLGLGVETDCTIPPKASVGARWTKVDSYVISISFDYPGNSSCEEIRIISPGPVEGLTYVKSINKDFDQITWQDFQASRQSLPTSAFRLFSNELGQPVLDINLRAFPEKPAIFEATVHGIHAEDFDRFRLTLPGAFAEDRRDQNSHRRRVPLSLTSVLVSSDFNVVEVSPSTTGQRRSVGPDIIYFGEQPLTEMSITAISLTRERWKTVYSVFAASVLCSLIAAWAYSRMSNPLKN